jgi:hypothetical protein
MLGTPKPTRPVYKENWRKTTQPNTAHRPRGRAPHEPATLSPEQEGTTLKVESSRATATTSTLVPRPRTLARTETTNATH